MHVRMLMIREKFEELSLWTYVLLLFVIVCFLTLKIILILQGIINDMENASINTMANRFVVPCDAVSLSAIEDSEMLKDISEIKRKNGVNFCTFRNVTDIVDKIAERESRIRFANGNRRSKPLACGNPLKAEPAHHSLAHFTDIRSLNKDYVGTILNWSNSSTSSFVGKELNYDNGKLRVNSNIFYFIYLSLTFRQGPNVIEEKLKQDRLMTFKVSVYKKNAMYDSAVAIPLLEYVEPVCSENGDVVTMRLASHVFINRNDEIFVKVMGPDRLVLDSPGNTFGIFKLM